MATLLRVTLPLAAAALTSLLASPALAGQVVIFDETWVHSADIPDSHHYIESLETMLDDWTAPIDYTQGTVWIHLEVLTKPTDTPTRFQLCMEGTPTYACTNQSPVYTDVGVYEWETTFDQMWSPPNEIMDWSQGVNAFACILKDTDNGKPSAGNVGEETAALYMPTQVRMVMTVVEAGSVYMSPSEMGGESDTGGETDGGGETEGTSTDGDSGSSEDESDSGDSGSEESGDPEPSTEDSGSSESAGQAPTAGSGCGCSSTPAGRGPLGLVGLLLGGLLLSRRRR